MRESGWCSRLGAVVGAAVLLMLPTVSLWGAEAPAAAAAPKAKALPDFCALLDDPEKRALMDGLLLKLAVECNRTDLLGQVRQEPAETIAGEVGTDVRVNDPSGDTSGWSTQSETSLAINETTGTICSAYNDSGLGASDIYTGFSRSTDGGATFTDRGGLTSGSYGDPSMVWRKSDGYFYLATLGSSSLRVYRSTDDCMTFTQAGSMGAGGGDDKEIMTVDNNPASPYYGRLYVLWTDFGSGQQIKSTYSNNGGASWSTPVVLSSSSGVQGAWPAVAPNGTVYGAWAAGLFTGTMSIEVKKSTDGGATWAAALSPAAGKVEPRDATATGICGRPSLRGNIRYLPSPQVAVGSDNSVHIVYTYDPDGYNTGDVVNTYYRRSTDAGATWEAEVLVNDDGTTRDQFFPSLSVGAGNIVSVAWYDRRLDPSNLNLDYYQRFSFDGGTTWEPSVRVSDVSTPVYLDPNLATCYHSDYDTQVQGALSALLQWSDDRAMQFGHNDPDVYVDQQPVSNDFLLAASPRRQSVCAPADAVYGIDVLQFQGFIEPVTLSATGVPAGVTTGFSANPVTPPGNSLLTVGVPSDLPFGSYTIGVSGTSSPSSAVHTTEVTVDVFHQAAGALTLSTPANGALNQPLRPSFTWTASIQAATYGLQVATDAGFTNVVLDAPGLTTTSYTPTIDLNSNTHYYWRVQAYNICGASGWAASFDFYTEALPGDCGTGTVPEIAFTDDFELGAGLWTHSGSGDTWALWGTQVHSGSAAFHANGTASVTDQRLVSPSIVLPATAPGLTMMFWNRQQIEAAGPGACYDGAIVEVSTDGGSTWSQLPTEVMETDPYDGIVSGSFSNPLAGLNAWCNVPVQDWLRSVVDISAYAAQTVQFRFRLGTDSSVGYEGWSIDDVVVQACVAGETPMFGDGFETGDTSAWSYTQP